MGRHIPGPGGVVQPEDTLEPCLAWNKANLPLDCPFSGNWGAEKAFLALPGRGREKVISWPSQLLSTLVNNRLALAASLLQLAFTLACQRLCSDFVTKLLNRQRISPEC